MLRLCDFRSQNSSITAMGVEYVGMQFFPVITSIFESYDWNFFNHNFILNCTSI